MSFKFYLYKIGKLLFMLSCAGLYVYSAVDISGIETHNIHIDMARPVSIVSPFEISIVGEMGEKGLRIGPKIGRGWRGEAGGAASYRFYVPEDGEYILWVYCLWYDECANAIFCRIDDLDRAIVGNDPIYNQWHWVRGFEVYLEKGTHSLVLSNHSDHISVQTILFTGSETVTPVDCGRVFTDIFYDGFDGCDMGNFADWQVLSGSWRVEDPEAGACQIKNVVIGESESTSRMFYFNDKWSDYCFNVSVRTEHWPNSGSSVGVCVGVIDENSYYEVRFCSQNETDKVLMEIIRHWPGGEDVMSSCDIVWTDNVWHHLQVTCGVEAIIVSVDKNYNLQANVSEKLRGGIGLSLRGRMSGHFDDIHVRKIHAKE